MNKNIYIDGLGLVDGHFSGVGQYILGILRGLDELLTEAKYNGDKYPDIYVFIPRDTVPKFRSFGFKNIGYKSIPIPFRYMSALWIRGKMPPIDLWLGKGYYIFPRFVSMPLLFSKYSIVIYDLSYELYRQYSDERNAIFLSNSVKKSLTKADHVFTISKNAKKEIVDFYMLPKDFVSISTPAADQRYFYRRSQNEIDKIKEKYDIRGDYILALSNLEPRKNLDALVEAYCNLPKKYRDNNSLLLVGVSGWKADKLFQTIIQRVKDGYNIIRPSGYVSDLDKPAVISGAKMLVYPSHYEGFGMPPLEALACGVPVITADNSSLPEVVSDAGVMLECTDTKEITKQMRKYLDNIKEETSKSIIGGPLQASNFNWGKSAKIYWDYVMEQTQ